MSKTMRKSGLKDTNFGVRMPGDEVRALDEKAAASGISRGELLRRSAAGNIAIVDSREFRRTIEELVAMHRDYVEHADRLASLAEQAMAQDLDERGILLEAMLDEREQMDSSRRSMRQLAEKAGETLTAMRDAVESANLINR